ncbi:MAG: hypothetical protein ACFB5Z_01890 [Elainellaceae cyanobacterium]
MEFFAYLEASARQSGRSADVRDTDVRDVKMRGTEVRDIKMRDTDGRDAEGHDAEANSQQNDRTDAAQQRRSPQKAELPTTAEAPDWNDDAMATSWWV